MRIDCVVVMTGEVRESKSGEVVETVLGKVNSQECMYELHLKYFPKSFYFDGQ